jgi:hypothetical protein
MSSGSRQAIGRRTVVVEGPLAFRTRRLAAARQGETGLHIASLPLLAARLAGGFCRPARSHDLEPAIRTALDEGGFAQLDGVRALPGMTRSVMWTLTKVWDADLSLSARTAKSARIADLALIEKRVQAALPPGALTPRELRDAALGRLGYAPQGAGFHSARNPERYRVILFDQRGCGKSTPSASDDDATAALT